MLMNFAGVAFWSEQPARLIVITFMASAMLMMGLYSWFGFGKILGLGHALWIPLLAWVLTQVGTADGVFRSYLISLCVATAVSLTFDVADVWRYFAARTRYVAAK